MADIVRKHSGVRGPTQGQYNKPGYFYPNAAATTTDYGLVERKTVDTKEKPATYLTAHPVDSALKLTLTKMESDEDNVKTRTRIYRTLPGQPTSKFVFDEEINAYVEIITQDLAIGTAAPTDPLIIQCSDSENAQGWITRTSMKLSGAPATKTEYKTEQFTFPAILQSLAVDAVSVGEGNVTVAEDTVEWLTGINTFVAIKPVIRPAISAPTVHKVVTEFFYKNGAGNFINSAGTSVGATLTADAVYEILPNNVRFSGRLFDFNFGEVLNDALTLSATAGAYDMSLKGLTESVTFGVSSPTKTAYNAAIGTEIKLASDVLIWRGAFYIKRNTYINLR